jgi:hypothetical protein
VESTSSKLKSQVQQDVAFAPGPDDTTHLWVRALTRPFRVLGSVHMGSLQESETTKFSSREEPTQSSGQDGKDKPPAGRRSCHSTDVRGWPSAQGPAVSPGDTSRSCLQLTAARRHCSWRRVWWAHDQGCGVYPCVGRRVYTWARVGVRVCLSVFLCVCAHTCVLCVPHTGHGRRGTRLTETHRRPPHSWEIIDPFSKFAKF